MSSILIKNKGPKALVLNESQTQSGSKKYVFEGVFTQCGIENRNNRIYDPEEVLPHLAYLRDKIKSEGCILGELDHPEGRFEIYLKDASHMITDLWYEPKTKCVMGKLELLNTPNGKTIQAIVEAGCPLFVSSRAAGTVGPDKHVSIQQIFTYDIVAVPGFAEARLDQVNESMRAQVMSFLNESKTSQEKKNLASEYGLDETAVEVFEASKEPEITAKKRQVSIEELSKPINEDIKVKVSAEKARELGLIGNSDEGQSASSETQDNSGEEQKQHSADEILGIVPKYAGQDPGFIKDIQPEFKSPESGSDSNGASTSVAQPQQNNTPNTQMQESKKGKSAYINLVNETKKEEAKSNKDEVKTKYEEEIDLNETGEDESTPNPVADGKKGSDTDKVVSSSHKKEEKEEKAGNDDKVNQKATSKNDTAEKQSKISESKKVSKNKKINESYTNVEDYFNNIPGTFDLKLSNGWYESPDEKACFLTRFGDPDVEGSENKSIASEIFRDPTARYFIGVHYIDSDAPYIDLFALTKNEHNTSFDTYGIMNSEEVHVDDDHEIDFENGEICDYQGIKMISKQEAIEIFNNNYYVNESIKIKQDKNLQRLINKKNEIKESTDRILGFYESLIEGEDTKASIRESIIRQWPFSVSLSETNFEKFATLSPVDKNKCAQFIWEHQIFDIKQINETFMRPLIDQVNEMKNFLRLADKSDVDLYMNAPLEVQKNIEEQAACFVLESKEDVDEFWRLTGLREAVAKKIQNESFVENYNKQMAEGYEGKRDENGFLRTYGYDQSFIDQVGKMM